MSSFDDPYLGKAVIKRDLATCGMRVSRRAKKRKLRVQATVPYERFQSKAVGSMFGIGALDSSIVCPRVVLQFLWQS